LFFGLQEGSLAVRNVVEAHAVPVVRGWARSEAVLVFQWRVVLHVVHDVEVAHLVIECHSVTKID
jgi:hypothetical protein